jgi:hypothetical protein
MAQPPGEAAKGITTVVTWTLTPTTGGVLVRMEQSGFRPEDESNYKGAGYGWQKFVGALEQVAAGLHPRPGAGALLLTGSSERQAESETLRTRRSEQDAQNETLRTRRSERDAQNEKLSVLSTVNRGP